MVNKRSTFPGYLFFTGAGICYLIVHLVAVWTGSPLLWGVDSWTLFPLWAVYLLFIAGVVVFVPGVPGFILKSLSPVVQGAGRIPRLAWVAVAGALFWFFRQRTFFLGDGQLRIRDNTLHLENGMKFPFITREEPLDTFLHSGAYYFLHPFGVTSLAVYQWVSILAGLMLVGFLLWYLPRIYMKRIERFTLGAVVLTAGTVQFFFGYVESYTIAWLFILIALLSGLGMVRNGRFAYLPGISLAVAAAFHPLSLAIAPGILYAYWLVFRSEGQPAAPFVRKTVFMLTGMALIGTGTFALLMTGKRLYPDLYLGGTDISAMFLKLVPHAASYTLFSLPHAIDIANELFLVLPAGLAVFCCFRNFGAFRKDGGMRFLLLSAVGPALVLLMLDPKLGFSRDWDLFSLISLPVALIIGEGLITLPAMTLSRVLIPLLTVAIVHTGPWIMINASEPYSLGRFTRLMNTPSWSDASQGMGYESLGSYYSERKMYFEAAEGYTEAFDHTGNIRFYWNVIAMYQRSEDADRLAEFVHGHKDFAAGYFYLGDLYVSKSRYQEAADAYRKAISLEPDYPEVYFNLGYASMEMNRFDEALGAFEKALAQANDSESRALVLLNRGVVYFNLKQFDNAVTSFQAAIAENQDLALAHFNLAIIAYQRMEYDSALKYAREALSHGYPPDAGNRFIESVQQAQESSSGQK